MMYMICEMHWSSTCLSLCVDITSSWHDVAGIVATVFPSYCPLTGANLVCCAISS